MTILMILSNENQIVPINTRQQDFPELASVWGNSIMTCLATEFNLSLAHYITDIKASRTTFKKLNWA